MSDWIDWNGGSRPVDAGVTVEVVLMSGTTETNTADCFDWTKKNYSTDIVSYKVVEKTGNKYQREIRPGVHVDVYDVLQAWEVKNPALQHLIKKALQPGERGHKDLEQDLDDIIASAIRAKELETR